MDVRQGVEWPASAVGADLRRCARATSPASGRCFRAASSAIRCARIPPLSYCQGVGVIKQSAIDPGGSVLMNLYPLPNANPAQTGGYNLLERYREPASRAPSNS